VALSVAEGTRDQAGLIAVEGVSGRRMRRPNDLRSCLELTWSRRPERSWNCIRRPGDSNDGWLARELVTRMIVVLGTEC